MPYIRVCNTPNMSPNFTAEGASYACPYPVGAAVAVYGGTAQDPQNPQNTVFGVPPVAWANNLHATLGLTAEAQATVCLRWVPSLLWTAYWDPTGQSTPAPFFDPGLVFTPPPE
jgi:hypothetical protein